MDTGELDKWAIDLLRDNGVTTDDIGKDREKIRAAGMTAGDAAGELLSMLTVAAVRVIRKSLHSANERIRNETAWRILEKAGEIKVNRNGPVVHFHFKPADAVSDRMRVLDLNS
jgi:hypothetical protein